MITAAKAAIITFGLGLLGPLEQFRKLPTPEALNQEVTSRLLKNYREALAATIKWRKQLEENPDPRVPESHATRIAQLKEWEADFRRRIERLEKGALTPTAPAMPSIRPGDTRPKPPIRD